METVYTAVFKDSAFVKIIGKGNFLNSLPVKEWILSKIEEGFSRFIVNLFDCKSMDSTFMGALTGVSLRMRRLGKSSIILSSITAHNKRLLETLGLDKFFIIEEEMDEENLKWEQLPFIALDKLETTKHMMESHGQLINTGEKSKKQFESVHNMIKKDFEKQIKDKEKNGKT